MIRWWYETDGKEARAGRTYGERAVVVVEIVADELLCEIWRGEGGQEPIRQARRVVRVFVRLLPLRLRSAMPRAARMHGHETTHRWQRPELWTFAARLGRHMDVCRRVRLTAVARGLDNVAVDELPRGRDELEGAALSMEAQLIVGQIPLRRALRRL